MSDSRKIADRIARDLGAPELISRLIKLPANELTSLLLEVTRGRARRPADLVAQYARDRAVQPTSDDPRPLRTVEQHAFAAAAGFEPITLSPVAPLGLNVVLGDIDQNSTLAAVRNLEVLADPTTVMALETARRQALGVGTDVRLAAAARMLRMQPFDNPAFSPHFAIFALTTGGRGRSVYGFELAALGDHLTAHLATYASLDAAGFAVRDARVDVSDSAHDEARLAAVENELFPTLRARFPAATFTLDRARTHAMAYYRGLCFHITARGSDGATYQLSDGGSTDWLARLTSNRKQRFFVSGFGSELLLRRFQRSG